MYLEDPLEKPTPLDILQWWKNREERHPHLSGMARDILFIPITSVASESSFSLGGRVLNKWRTCILSDTLEALMTTRNWLHGYTMGKNYTMGKL
ncbi:Putative AC transposase [Linum perenne]